MRVLALSLLVLGLCGTTSWAASRATKANPGWGRRSQIGGLVQALDERSGERSTSTGFVRRQPLLRKLSAFLRPGLSTRDDILRLERYLADSAARHGQPISTLEHPALTEGLRLRAQKALALDRFGRSPAEVTEAFIHATAQVKGEAPIADRELFVQRWRPSTTPSGKVFVLAPGFLQTGRNFYEQIQLLNAAGHEAVVMDQQWGGYTADSRRGPQKGGIDSGFGIARDVAEVAAYGHQLLEREYAAHPGKQLVLVGTSMGGGPGVLLGLKLHDEGQLDLGAGRAIPADRGYILQGAFLGRSPGLINASLDLLGRLPWLRDRALPATGLPRLNTHAQTNAKLATHTVVEDLRGRAQAFRASLPALRRLREMIERSGAPEGLGYAIHADRDLLADPAALILAAGRMVDTVQLHIIPGQDHVIEETEGEQRHLLSAARAVDNHGLRAR